MLQNKYKYKYVTKQIQIQIQIQRKYNKSHLPSQRFVPEMQVSGSLFHSVIERIVFTWWNCLSPTVSGFFSSSSNMRNISPFHFYREIGSHHSEDPQQFLSIILNCFLIKKRRGLDHWSNRVVSSYHWILRRSSFQQFCTNSIYPSDVLALFQCRLNI